ncbi:MAG: hypothetical protein MHM6MM_000593 [Cercozoa sp. M6MM]
MTSTFAYAIKPLAAVHEKITMHVLEQSSAWPRHKDLAEAIVIGTRWPDVPCASKEIKTCTKEAVLLIFCFRSNPVEAKAVMFASKKVLRMTLFNSDTIKLAKRSHTGDLQYWYHHDRLVIIFLVQFYKKALDELASLIVGDLEKKAKLAQHYWLNEQRKHAAFVLGKVFHTIQDSFAFGHTLREQRSENVHGRSGYPVLFGFQSTEEQNESLHRRYDKRMLNEG